MKLTITEFELCKNPLQTKLTLTLCLFIGLIVSILVQI